MGLKSKLTGPSDVCHPIRDFSSCLAMEHLLPSETILMSLQSTTDEFTFTNEALLTISGSNTTVKRVARYEYITQTVSDITFETAVHIDRDCEIKFHVGSTYISIPVAKADAVAARMCRKVLVLLAREQHTNTRKWEFRKEALEHSAAGLRSSEQSGITLTSQAEDVANWMEAQYTLCNPRCYRDVILRALEDAHFHVQSITATSVEDTTAGSEPTANKRPRTDPDPPAR